MPQKCAGFFLLCRTAVCFSFYFWVQRSEVHKFYDMYTSNCKVASRNAPGGHGAEDSSAHARDSSCIPRCFRTVLLT